jgi:hypothetical protein
VREDAVQGRRSRMLASSCSWMRIAHRELIVRVQVVLLPASTAAPCRTAPGTPSASSAACLACLLASRCRSPPSPGPSAAQKSQCSTALSTGPEREQSLPLVHLCMISVVGEVCLSLPVACRSRCLRGTSHVACSSLAPSAVACSHLPVGRWITCSPGAAQTSSCSSLLDTR